MHVLLVETTRLLDLTFFCGWGFHTMKHNRDPESKPKLQAAQGKLIWEPPEYPGPCFDLHFNRFDGFIFEAQKPFENVCATGAFPEASSQQC